MGKRLVSAMSEKDVMAFTGMSEDAIRPLRLARLEKGADWFRDGMTIHYTETGLGRLKEALGGIEIAPPMEKTAPGMIEPVPMAKETAALPDTADLHIERVCPNPTFVQCRLNGGLVNVRVKNNRGMARGKMLVGCQNKNGTWFWAGRCW